MMITYTSFHSQCLQEFSTLFFSYADASGSLNLGKNLFLKAHCCLNPSLQVIFSASKSFSLYFLLRVIYLNLDEIVLKNERDRIDMPSNDDVIKLVHVQKTYPNGVSALQNLTFGIKKNEVFCLLGSNGAGKSTAFEIMSGNISPSAGKIQIKGKSLSRKYSAANILEQAGICLQTNALWDTLTVEQHLKIYARLKGINKQETKEIISFLIQSLYLDKDVHKEVRKLSGGNKRKLCVAIALIAAPELIFLDEPSTSMDPISRRQVWMLLKSIMSNIQSTIVLTTHYMEEAELISDRIGNFF